MPIGNDASTVFRIQFITSNKATGEPLCAVENNYPHDQYLTRSGQKIMKVTLKLDIPPGFH